MRFRPPNLHLDSESIASAGIPKDKGSRLYHIDAVNPFLVSGGCNFFLPEFTTELFDVRQAGVQLVCYVYVPPGTVGFLKEIRVAPFKPAVFCPSYYGQTTDDANLNWIWQNDGLNDEPIRPGGVWETPFGWESYYDASGELTYPPSWRWFLRAIPGNIADLRVSRNNLPSPLPPALPLPAGFWDSWFLIPDYAVPSDVYLGGIPGTSVGTPWDGQRMQVIQGDKLSLHVPIPPNTSLALFTRWRQEAIQPKVGYRGEGGDTYYNYAEGYYFPLLPSFGQMLGYTQSANQEPGSYNAQFGWHG